MKKTHYTKIHAALEQALAVAEDTKLAKDHEAARVRSLVLGVKLKIYKLQKKAEDDKRKEKEA